MSTPNKSERNASIDLLRGIVMVVMAIDHARDFLGAKSFEPTDLTKTYPALFFTRWITHFCAPTFVFLAGTAAWLSRAKKSDAELTGFLLKRGAWLVFFELAINDLTWSFDLTYGGLTLQVIWAIGWAMIFLALLVRLSPRVVAAIGLAIVALHDLLDPVHLGAKTPWHVLWAIVHEQDTKIMLGNEHLVVLYPLVPWMGVMALGYALGSLYRGADGAPRSSDARAKVLVRIGAAVTLGFVALRALNVYGDPHPWAPQPTIMKTVMAFLDCQKYPPSLAYLAMTLGPGILFLGLVDRSMRQEPRGIAGIFVVYGRVPMFYYLLHVVLIHGVSEVVYSLKVGRFTMVRMWFGPEALDVGLPWMYVTWAAAVAALYPLCLWFSRVKASTWGRQQWWLSYL